MPSISLRCRNVTSAETSVAKVAMGRWGRRFLPLLRPCPSPVLVKDRLRLSQIQTVVLLYASVLAVSLAIAVIESLLACAFTNIRECLESRA